jgi:hypothetical protein
MKKRRSRLPRGLRHPLVKWKIGDQVHLIKSKPFGDAFRSRLRAATNLEADDPRRGAWSAAETASWEKLPQLLEYLPHRLNRVGRPRGPKVDRQELFRLLAAAKKAGKKLGTVAREYYRRREANERQLKNLADSAVKAFKSRDK